MGVLERFLRKFLDPKQCLPSDAVSRAALGGQNHMVALLMGNGIDIEREALFGTPLRAARLMGLESTVRILLNRDASLTLVALLEIPFKAQP